MLFAIFLKCQDVSSHQQNKEQWYSFVIQDYILKSYALKLFPVVCCYGWRAHGQKLEEVGATFSSSNEMPAKITKKNITVSAIC